MYLQRYYLECLSHASYMVADEQSRRAAVIDPQRDIDIYLEDARQHGFKIEYVILTHFHADFVAGHIELRDRVGARIALGRRAEAEFGFQKLADGDSIDLGNVRLKVLETPGHTPEGVSILVYDLEQDAARPKAVFTGDTLFIGDVGRPDLLASIGVTAEELAGMLYDSLHKLMKLPDETLVYPAHGAGSMCGKNLSDEAVSTIGEQRKYNYALQPMSREDFVKLVEVAQPDAPEYFVYDAILNRQERTNLEASMERSMQPLSLEQVLQLQSEGAQVVDVRDASDFAGGHLRGVLNVGLKGKYATWAGTVLNHEDPIVVIADSGSAEEAVMRLGRIGYDNVRGYLQYGMSTLESRPGLLQKVERVTAQALNDLLKNGRPAPVVLDVRTDKERGDVGFIDGSLAIPLNHLKDRVGEVPAGRDVVVHCAGGYRSSIACSLLQQHGYEHVRDMVGGFKAWTTSKLPVTETVAS